MLETTTTEDDDELKTGLELDALELEELESGRLVDTAVFDAAAERHEQTAPAELRAARAVTIPQAAIAQFNALATIFTEEAEVHYDEVRTPLAIDIVHNATRA